MILDYRQLAIIAELIKIYLSTIFEILSISSLGVIEKISKSIHLALFRRDSGPHEDVTTSWFGNCGNWNSSWEVFWFCKNSGNDIGMGDGLIARKNRKLIILKPEELIIWNNIKNQIMYKILLAKFTQIPIAKQVLLLTYDAILLHGAKGIPICRQIELEKVRNRLKNI